MNRARPPAAGIGAVAIYAVITRSSVVGMSTGSGTVANIIGADVAVIGTAGAISGIAVVCSLVTDVVALRPAAARVAGMVGACPPTAGIGAVAV